MDRELSETERKRFEELKASGLGEQEIVNTLFKEFGIVIKTVESTKSEKRKRSGGDSEDKSKNKRTVVESDKMPRISITSSSHPRATLSDAQVKLVY